MIKIRIAYIKEIVQLSQQIPEFYQPHGLVAYQKRLAKVQHLLLIAEEEGKPLGFKAGYDRFSNKSFYSWMGGVLPEARRKGIAKALAQFQEAWAIEQGFEKIAVKTRNRHVPMLLFLLNNGYRITDLEKVEAIADHRIWLEKKL